MLKLVLFLILVIMITSQTNAEKYYKGKVILLNQKTIERLFTDFTNVVILFESAKCQYCNSFAQLFHKTAQNLPQTLQVSKIHIQLAKIAFEGNEKIFEKYNITQVPEIRVFKNVTLLPCNYSNLFEYTIEYIESFKNWVLQKFNPIPEYIQLQKIPSHKTKVILFDCNRSDIEAINLFKISDNRNQYFCTNNKTISNSSTILLNKDGIINLGQATGTKLQTLIKRYEDGIVRPLDDYTMSLIFQKNMKSFVLLTHYEDNSYASLVQFRKIAQEYLKSSNQDQNRVLFIHSRIDMNTQLHVQFRSYIGQKPKQYPYPHLTYLIPRENQVPLKYHTYGIQAKYIKDWINSAYNLKQPLYYKNQKKKNEEKEDTDVFALINYDKLKSLYEDKTQQHDILLYVLNTYCQQCVINLEIALKNIVFKPEITKYIKKISLIDNDLIDQIKVDTIPQLIRITKQKKLIYLNMQHNVNNITQFIHEYLEQFV